jgi:hypothetical protein
MKDERETTVMQRYKDILRVDAILFASRLANPMVHRVQLLKLQPSFGPVF